MPSRPSISPWRDALLAGLGVAAAISLGAYIVYERAWVEKVADVRHHVAELAKRLSRSSAGPTLAAKNLPPAQRAQVAGNLSAPLSYVRDNSDEVRRIYTFAIEDDEKLTLLDTGANGEKAAARPLPPHASKAREQLKMGRGAGDDGEWTISDGLEATAFSLLPDRNNKPGGIIGIEADADKLQIKIGAVRQALWFTCLLGLGVGFVSGGIVWRMRIRAALHLAEIEENHRVEDAIISSLGEVIYTFDTVTGLFRWRGNAEQLLGFAPDPEGERKSSWLSRLHDDDLPRYVAELDKALQECGGMRLEYRVRRRDGSIVWVLDRSNAIRLRGGHINLVGSLIDLTARQRAEETLRLFFDETATSHVAIDGDAIVDANPAAIALFAAGDEETLKAQPTWALWPRRQPTNALSVEGWSTHVLEAMEKGTSHFEWQFARLDGSRIDCDVFLRQATLQDRPVLLMACYDISPAKLAQAQLIVSEQRFRDVSEAAGEFIWEVEREGRYVYASRRVTDVLGIEPEELLGRSPYEFVPPEEREDVNRRSVEIQRSGLAFRNFEHRVQRADGAVLWISVSGVPIYDAGGQTVGYRGASLDITKHRDYERELVLQKEAAEAADRAKSNFLAMMSHEIRTPLNSVLGFADLVLETPLNPTQRDHLQTIKSSGDALLVLLNDILDFSKIESGRMEIEIRPVDLPRCIREVLELYQLTATAKKLTFATEVSENVPRHILTDWSRLRQILLNLVGNAVKFTAEGGVRVAASLHPAADPSEKPQLRIVVSDTGIGISAEQRERLFKPFTQADSSTTRRFGGTGLGLAISRRLATLLGGSLGILDREEPGSSFYVDLPAVVPTARELEDLTHEPDLELFSSEAPKIFNSRAPRVLVVDDNTLNRRLTTHLLHQLGAETMVAASAGECFEKLGGERFDLVLMDVQMPTMDGLDATRHIRALELERHLPIVALTADAMVGDRERCLEAGMDDYLTKPLRREELARVLQAFAPADSPA